MRPPYSSSAAGRTLSTNPGCSSSSLCSFHQVADLVGRRFAAEARDECPFASTSSSWRPISPSMTSSMYLEPDGFLVLADRFDQQVLQRRVDVGVAEHVVDLVAVHAALLLDLLEQPLEHLAFAGLVGDEVPQVARLLLADAVDAAEALLDPVRVPRQVVVDHQVGDLQVDALAGGVGGDEDLHGRVDAEPVLDLSPVVALDAAVDRRRPPRAGRVRRRSGPRRR